MDKVFLTKLKGTLQRIIDENKALRAEVNALNHSVNDVIIGGLKDAALEYEDNEKYSEFYDTYNDSLSPFAEDCKILYGDDYDIIEEMYSGSKGSEDVGSYITEQINALQSKLDKLRAVKNGTSESSDEGTEEEIDEEDLARIAREML